MRHECGACGGSGRCQNDHHNFYEASATALMGEGVFPCPACGEDPATPGNCSVCGGEGWQDD